MNSTTNSNNVRKKVPAASVLLFLLTAIAFVTVAVVQTRDLSAQDTPRVSEVCLDCHDDIHLEFSPHQIPASGGDGPDALVACTICHPGSEDHWEDDPEENPMTNPATADLTTIQQICSTCHLNSHQQNMLEKNVHFQHDISCVDCHKVHDNTSVGLLKKDEYDLCIECHTTVRGQFNKPFRHPVEDKVMKCSECHLTLDLTGQEATYAGGNIVCFACHNRFQGPFPFEHLAVPDFTTEEGSCQMCHDPHGSSLPRMTKQTYESPDFMLCTQCHSVPGHNNNSQHGTTWAGVPCNDCHVDIHGSYTSQYFFSAALQGASCFNVGCHQY